MPTFSVEHNDKGDDEKPFEVINNDTDGVVSKNRTEQQARGAANSLNENSPELRDQT